MPSSPGLKRKISSGYYCLADKHSECLQIQVPPRVFRVWSLLFTSLLISCHFPLSVSHSSNAKLLLFPCGHEAFYLLFPCVDTFVLTVFSPCPCLHGGFWSPFEFLLWFHLLRSLSQMTSPCSAFPQLSYTFLLLPINTLFLCLFFLLEYTESLRAVRLLYPAKVWHCDWHGI